MSKHLVVLRHGHALNADSDFDRPLSPQGLSTAAQVGQQIASYEPSVDLIVSSTALRAEQTALAVSQAFAHPPELRWESALYLAPPDLCVRLLEQLSDELACVLLVGHNPGLSDLVHRLWGTRVGLSPAQFIARSLEIDSWMEIS